MEYKLEKPLFIVFEGIDGSGKSTQSRMLHQHLIDNQVPAIHLAEPSTGKWGLEIRRILSSNIAPDPEEQHRLFLLDREDDVAVNIAPALNDGTTVILDRYYFSNAAYQGSGGLSPEKILSDNRAKKFPQPDRVYFIDIEPDTALERISLRNSNEENDLFEKKPFLEKVRNIYLSIQDQSFLTIDGTKSIEEISSDIKIDISKNFISSHTLHQ